MKRRAPPKTQIKYPPLGEGNRPGSWVRPPGPPHATGAGAQNGIEEPPCEPQFSLSLTGMAGAGAAQIFPLKVLHHTDRDVLLVFEGASIGEWFVFRREWPILWTVLLGFAADSPLSCSEGVCHTGQNKCATVVCPLNEWIPGFDKQGHPHGLSASWTYMSNLRCRCACGSAGGIYPTPLPSTSMPPPPPCLDPTPLRG